MKNQTKQPHTKFIILIFIMIALLFANICIGSVSIPFVDAVRALIGGPGGIWGLGAVGTSGGTGIVGGVFGSSPAGSDAAAQNYALAVDIIWGIRLPRALSALILGGALALAGYLLQTFFHNPIAGPFVLGISSGAKLAVALVMVFAMGKLGFGRVSAAVLILAAFVGAMTSMSFVLVLAGKVSHMSLLIVGGVMIGYICSAITELVVTFADDADIVNLHNWSMGSFSGISWENVAVMAAVVFPVCVFIFILSKPISALMLGESYAQNLGVNVRVLRVLLVLLSSLLSACIVAFAGPISFVGIAVPHLVKSFLKTTRPIATIPACFLGGSIFCLFCDLLARTVFAPTELSISTVTAIFGAPVVLVVMIRRRRQR